MISRRSWIWTAAVASAALSAPFASALAQSPFPSKPIRMVVPFPPGGGTDTTARLVAEKLTKGPGWTVVVDNRAGAAGNIGVDLVAKAAPDGYTLAMGQTSNLAINPSLYPKLPYDPLKDLTPIAGVAEQPVVLVVRKDSPFHSLDDMIKAAKAAPGKYSIAQAGTGTVGHLAGELLATRAGIKVLQVPYKGAGPAMTDLLGGQVDLYFGSAGSVIGQVKGGEVRALAVTTSKRINAMPKVPTVAEQGYPGFSATTWLGLVGPKGMPPDVVAKINAEVVKLMASPDAQKRLDNDGSLPTTGTPAEFAKMIGEESTKWAKVINEAHVKLD